MIEFVAIFCMAYTFIDLMSRLLRWIPDWLAYDESEELDQPVTDFITERHP